MRKFGFIFIFILFILFKINLFSQIMTPEKVVGMISNRFATIDNFYASFVERNGSRISRGEVISKNPNLFKLEYSAGTNGQQIYCNGKTLWIIFPQKKIVSEQTLNYGDTGAIYTKAGVSRLTSKYNVNFYNARELKPINSFDGSELNIAGYNSSLYTAEDTRLAYHMLLTPKQARVDRTGFPTIHLWVDRDGMIIRILGISTINTPVEYLFTSIRYNIKLEEKTFTPEIPEEMQVLKDGLMPNN